MGCNRQGVVHNCTTTITQQSKHHYYHSNLYCAAHWLRSFLPCVIYRIQQEGRFEGQATRCTAGCIMQCGELAATAVASDHNT